MKHPITLAQARAEGRDPLSIFRADRALLVDGGWLARIEAGAPLMFWGQEDDEEDDDETEPQDFELCGGVGIVDIEGPIAQRGWFCIDGYDTIARSLSAALAHPQVSEVIMRINSPGGAAAGAFEWTRQMRDEVIASKKRCVAYADEMALSGAYAIACVADEIVVPETGVAGSVGVIASMVSRAKKNTMDGIDVRVVSAGSEKADGHPDKPLDAGAIEREQQAVDQLAAIFQRWVGERRGMTVDAVAALEAGIRMGPDAVAARLADRVQGWHALVAEMQARAARPAAAPATIPMRSPMGASANSSTSSTSTRKIMDEKIIAALTAATGEADTDKAVGMLIEKHAAATQAVEGLTRDLGAANARVAEAEAACTAVEREAILAGAKAAGKWSLSLEPFLATLSVEQLKSWSASAPRVVPAGEISPPSEPGGAGAGAMPADVAAAVAKARDGGWKSLSAREKHAITQHNPTLAQTFRAS